jgi:transposase InsO family protein
MSILDRREPKVPLPKAWPSIAKSAIVHALALAHLVATHVRGWCADSPLRRVRLAGECEQLRSEVAMLREELRIKDARLARIPPRSRPHYPPAERLAVLALKAARAWNLAQTAAHFLLEPATIASWLGRIDEEGPDALVRSRPVNRFPDFLADIVGRIKATFPLLGTQRIANILARAGLHVARTTVRRLLKHRARPPAPAPADAAVAEEQPSAPRRIISRGPNHTWLVDLTIMPTAAGFWVPWLPFAIVQRWPFCWWIVAVIDHFSRTAVGHAEFRQQPTAGEVVRVLGRAVRNVGRAPKYLISDRGGQFQDEYRGWCRRRGVKPRFGAIGRHGSIAIIERFGRTLKDEGLRRILVPLGRTAMQAEVEAFIGWYNAFRPHESLRGATPNEVYRRVRPARDGPRFEIRARYPTRRGEKPRGKRGAVVKLSITHHEGRSHLPVVRLRSAA